MVVAPAARRSGATIASLTLASLAYAVMQMMVVPALPAIEHDLDTGPGGVSWLISAFLLSTAIATPVLGRLGDMYGKERLLTIVLAVFAAGGVLGALATSLPMLIAARTIQGLGGAIFPLSFAIARDTLPPRRLPLAIGLLSGTFGVGGGVGLVVSGVIVDHFSWHGIFWLGIAMPLIAIAGVRLFVAASPSRERVQLDWVGALLLAGGLLPLLLAVSRGQAWGWSSPGIVALFAGAALAVVAWGRWELGRREPLIDVRLLALRGVWTVNAAALCFGFTMYATGYLVPQLVQADPATADYGFAASTTAAALFLLPAMLAGLVCGPLAGMATTRLGAKRPLLLGVAVMAAGQLLLAFAHDQQWQVYVGTLLAYGVGLTFAMTATSSLIVSGVPQAQTGEATGMNTMVRTVGGSVGSQVVAALVVGSGTATSHGFTLAFAVCGALLLLAVPLVLLVPARRR